ncbi:hypothetical protein PoB_006349500 [Plakobranchus ocellatus]|uniref:Uncharacterized protein n=1 Tax=Plakobranchus ocellatus TaxID=259542 RepID=A0AAV4CYZ1_9GAST|nr:hypothetical protein PoB_006349500 [Plakobranchus ocellatus]
MSKSSPPCTVQISYNGAFNVTVIIITIRKIGKMTSQSQPSWWHSDSESILISAGLKRPSYPFSAWRTQRSIEKLTWPGLGFEPRTSDLVAYCPTSTSCPTGQSTVVLCNRKMSQDGRLSHIGGLPFIFGQGSTGVHLRSLLIQTTMVNRTAMSARFRVQALDNGQLRRPLSPLTSRSPKPPSPGNPETDQSKQQKITRLAKAPHGMLVTQQRITRRC